MAAGLVALGLQPRAAGRDRLRHPLEWVLADLARPVRRGGDHDGLPVDQRRGRRVHRRPTPQPRSCSPRTTAQVAKLVAHEPNCRPREGRPRSTAHGGDGDWVITLADLETLGGALVAEHPGASTSGSRRSGPDSLATLIYTSGTTGQPKGVRLLHAVLDVRGRRDRGDQHLDERRHPVPVAAAVALVRQGAARRARSQIGFATAVDGRVDKIVDEPRRRAADVHGRGAAHLREGPQPDRRRCIAEGRPSSSKIFNWAFDGRQARSPRCAQAGKRAARPARRAARDRRQARVLEDRERVRRPHPLLHLRLAPLSTARSPSGSTRRAS